jgi:hypothetical protein
MRCLFIVEKQNPFHLKVFHVDGIVCANSVLYKD